MYQMKQLTKFTVCIPMLIALLSITGCIKLKPVDTIAAKRAIEKVNAKPRGGGLVFIRDDFFEDDATIALGSAWLVTPDMSKAKLFCFGLDEVKPTGGRQQEPFRLVVKKDGSLDAGIVDVFGVKLTETNAVTVTVTKRSMTTNISHSQLKKWAETAANLLEQDELYVAFVMKITENIINTEEYTTDNYNGNLSINAIKIGGAAYGSSGQLKITEPVIWVGLTGCKWKRSGLDGKPSITIIAPKNFKETLLSFKLIK